LCGFHRIDKPRRAAPHRSAICEQALLEYKRKTSQQQKVHQNQHRWLWGAVALDAWFIQFG